MEFSERIIGLLASLDIEAHNLLEVPPDPKLGDFALPCFTLAKEQRKPPAKLAEELANKIGADDIIDRVTNTGPYVNFFIKRTALAEQVTEAALAGKLWRTGDQMRKVMIEYPAPNTNKPMHLGHVRNMTLGNSVSRILKKDGNKVIQVNLNNDRGIHICKSMLAYQKWGDDKQPDKKTDHFVGDYYVLFAQKEHHDNSLNDEAQQMLKLWEKGDRNVRKLWEKMNKWALDGFKETYARYHIKFDKEYFESEVYEQGITIVKEKKELFATDEKNNIIARLEHLGLPDKVVLRADGTSVYVTQDIALTMKKIKDYSPNLQIWVIGNEQNLYMKQMFAILKIIGINDETFHHLSYGYVSLPEGRMKSREGKVVDADDILDELEKLAAIEIGKRREDWPEKKIQDTAKIVAEGAIKFFMVKYDPVKDFTFDPKNSLSFEGDTGPYLQYTHARICSIIRKSGKIPNKADLKLLIEDEEQEVIRQLARIPDSFRAAAEGLKPSSLAMTLLELGRAANSFYHACPVTQAEAPIRDARLMLLTAVKNILSEGLDLLGITAPEEM
ncbi:arginine--tRNA ligase [Candidatus Woesearchaeota archaeon]|nr:arginine--tRNA ligase [Candidatus Woesearchaeota archaeon]